jgi:hypothetical protein
VMRDRVKAHPPDPAGLSQGSGSTACGGPPSSGARS